MVNSGKLGLGKLGLTEDEFIVETKHLSKLEDWCGLTEHSIPGFDILNSWPIWQSIRRCTLQQQKPNPIHQQRPMQG